MASVAKTLVSCSVYVSTGSTSVVQAIAQAFTLRTKRVAVIDVFTDTDYGRSSVKLVGCPTELPDAVLQMCGAALSMVDLSVEPSPPKHPRVGALDMIAFAPLTSQTPLAEDMQWCDSAAVKVAEAVGAMGCPVLLYGATAQRSLLQTRRLTSFFSPSQPITCSTTPDYGPAEITQSQGLLCCGCMHYVTNFNMQINSADLGMARAAASKLRKQMKVQVMALPHAEGSVEIACNLQASESSPTPPMEAVERYVVSCLPPGVSITRAYVIGFTPEEALERGVAAMGAADMPPST